MRHLCGRAREHHFDVNKPECGQFKGHGGREAELRLEIIFDTLRIFSKPEYNF